VAASRLIVDGPGPTHSRSYWPSAIEQFDAIFERGDVTVQRTAQSVAAGSLRQDHLMVDLGQGCETNGDYHSSRFTITACLDSVPSIALVDGV
jgi:hypothetical protein